MAIAGFAGLSIAEILSGAIGGSSTSSTNADAVGSAFGIASLLTAVGSIIAGLVIAHGGVWRGIGRSMVLPPGSSCSSWSRRRTSPTTSACGWRH